MAGEHRRDGESQFQVGRRVESNVGSPETLAFATRAPEGSETEPDSEAVEASVWPCATGRAMMIERLATFRRKNALSEIGPVTFHTTDAVSRDDFARVHSRARALRTALA